MTERHVPGGSSAGSGAYLDVLTSIVRRYVRLVGAPTAVNLARHVPDLAIDDDGNVLDYNRDNPLDTLSLLIDQYGPLFGVHTASLIEQATRPFVEQASDEPLLPAAAPGSSVKVTPMRVVLVDDHILFRDGLVRLLSPQPDIKVVGEAGSVREAVAVIRSAKPNVVLMDFSLPDGNGLDAAHAILSEMPTIKIVFLTVHDDDERLFAAIRAGAMGYLSKSVGAAELVSRLRGVVRGEAAILPATASRILEEFSRTPPPRYSEPSETSRLTRREIETIRALARGASNQEIAQQLVISENTVKNHVQNILNKLHLHSRRDVVDYARSHGLIPPSADASL